MSLKKVVGRMVVGAFATVVGLSGVVNAQTPINSPFLSDLPNAVDDVKKGSATMLLSHEIDLRAILYPIVNKPGEFTDGITELTDEDIGAVTGSQTVFGNVGWLLVETNAPTWDILVTLENGGYLSKGGGSEAVYGDSIDVLDRWGTPTGQKQQGPLITPATGGEQIQKWDPLSGVSGELVPCELQITVGIVEPAGLLVSNLSTDLGLPTYNTNGIVGDLTATKTAGSDGTDYYSFATALATAIDGNSTDASGYFGDTKWEDLDMATNGYFPMITEGEIMELDRAPNVGVTPYTQTPRPEDFTVPFYINARLNYDKTAGESLKGNKKGLYEETINFLFYGSY